MSISVGLPDAVVVGAPQCGTYPLHYFLSRHPSVKGADKPLHFFDRSLAEGREWYKERLPASSSSSAVVERTPEYMGVPEAPLELHEVTHLSQMML